MMKVEAHFMALPRVLLETVFGPPGVGYLVENTPQPVVQPLHVIVISARGEENVRINKTRHFPIVQKKGQPQGLVPTMISTIYVGVPLVGTLDFEQFRVSSQESICMVNFDICGSFTVAFYPLPFICPNANFY